MVSPNKPIKEIFSDTSSVPSYHSYHSCQNNYTDGFFKVRSRLVTYLNFSEKLPCSIIGAVDTIRLIWEKFITEHWDQPKEPKFESHACHIYLIIGIIYSDGFLYQECLPLLKKAEEISQIFYKKEEDMNGMIGDFFKNLYVVLAQVLSQTSKEDKQDALNYIDKALDLIKRFPDTGFEKTLYILRGSTVKDLKDVFLLLLAKGDIFMHSNLYEQAEHCYIEALNKIKEAHELYFLFLTCSRLLLVCAKAKKAQYLEYFDQAEEYWSLLEQRESDRLWKNTYLKGVYHFGKAVKLFHDERYSESKDEYKKSMAVLREKLPAKNWLKDYFREEYRNLTSEDDNEEDRESEEDKGINLNQSLSKLESGVNKSVNQTEECQNIQILRGLS